MPAAGPVRPAGHRRVRPAALPDRRGVRDAPHPRLTASRAAGGPARRGAPRTAVAPRGHRGHACGGPAGHPACHWRGRRRHRAVHVGQHGTAEGCPAHAPQRAGRPCRDRCGNRARRRRRRRLLAAVVPRHGPVRRHVRDPGGDPHARLVAGLVHQEPGALATGVPGERLDDHGHAGLRLSDADRGRLPGRSGRAGHVPLAGGLQRLGAHHGRHRGRLHRALRAGRVPRRDDARGLRHGGGDARGHLPAAGAAAGLRLGGPRRADEHGPGRAHPAGRSGLAPGRRGRAPGGRPRTADHRPGDGHAGASTARSARSRSGAPP